MDHRSRLLPALGLLACAVLHYSPFAHASNWPSTATPPLVWRDTRPDEWPDLRGRIETRLKRYLGERPPAALTHNVKFEELGRDEIAGLTRIRYRYHVIDDSWAEAYLILPPDFKAGETAPHLCDERGLDLSDVGGAQAEHEARAILYYIISVSTSSDLLMLESIRRWNLLSSVADQPLSARVFVVVGGTTGLGLSVARALPDPGARGAVVTGRDAQSATAAIAVLGRAGVALLRSGDTANLSRSM